MEMNALEDLLLSELAELYDAERQIVKALPKMAKAAERKELRAAFETHLKQTNKHVERLDRIFEALGREPEGKDSEPISQIIRQGDSMASEKHSDSAVLDAALISTAQKVEHYEIALYGSARSHANMLGYKKIAEVLEHTLGEERETDTLLTQLAVTRVNVDAARAPFGKARVAPRGGEELGGWGFGGLLAGILIGAAVAILYAPKSGEQLRSDLLERGEEWRGAAEDLIERGRQTINEQRGRFSNVG
jgi:ferritin-like metal-binding protein YciE